MTFDQCRLENLLEDISETKIQNMNFDILNNKITMIVEPFKKAPVSIIFEKVSAYYFVNNNGKERFRIGKVDPGDYTELTSIGYYKNGIGKISIISPDHWAPQWYSSANFGMELWAAALFVEANTITIDGETFEVGYPQIEEK